MGKIDHLLQQTCFLLATDNDRYGNPTLEESVEYPCRFREITQLDRLGNRDDINAIAMLWVAGDAPFVEKSIVKVNDRVYIVGEIVMARTLSGNDVQFRKCLLEKYKDSVDASSS